MTPHRIDRLLDSVSRNAEVGWESELRGLDDDDRVFLENLRLVSRISQAHRVLEHQDLDLPFTRWGRLRLVRRLGAGAFGEVFEAYDTALSLVVALKLFPVDSGANVLRTQALLQEVRHMARVRHPNVVHVFGAEVHQGRVGFWMDHVDGRSLEELLDTEGPLPADRVVSLGRTLADALHAVHEAGLLHGDIKPANVLVDARNRVFLTDFGCGTRLDGGVLRGGTPLYMAPEVRDHARATVAADIYSLGLVLHECATQSLPDAAGGEHRTEAPRLGRPLRGVVSRCLEQEPGKRFSTAAEVRDALDRTRSRGLPGLVTAAAAVVIAALLTTIVIHQIYRRPGFTGELGIAVLPTDVENSSFVVAGRSMDLLVGRALEGIGHCIKACLPQRHAGGSAPGVLACARRGDSRVVGLGDVPACPAEVQDSLRGVSEPSVPRIRPHPHDAPARPR